MISNLISSSAKIFLSWTHIEEEENHNCLSVRNEIQEIFKNLSLRGLDPQLMLYTNILNMHILEQKKKK